MNTFLYKSEEIPIPQHLIDKGVKGYISCDNMHLQFIIENTVEEIEGGLLYDYIEDMSADDIGELSYLFETFNLTKCIELLADLCIYKIKYTKKADIP